MGLFSGKKKRGSSSDEQIKESLKKLPEIREKISISEDIEKDSKPFFKLMRKVLSKKYKVKYEFTYEELNKDISRKRITEKEKIAIKSFCDDLIKYEFSNSNNSNEKLLEIIDSFEDIVFDGKKDNKKKEKKIIIGKPKEIIEGF